MNHTIKLSGFAFLLQMGLFFPLASQAQDEKGRLDDATLIVEKSRVNELPEASRNFEKFRIDPPEKQQRKVNFKFADYKLNDQNVNVAMRVLTIKPEDLPRLEGNYVKAGFGNYTTPYFKGYFNNTRNKDAAYGANVSHISSANGPVENSGVSNSSLGAYAETYRNNNTLGGRAEYEHDRYNFYGYSPQLENVNQDSIKQIFNRIGAEAYLDNNMAVSNLKYRSAIRFNYLTDNYQATEANISGLLNTVYTLDNVSRINTGAEFSYIKHQDALIDDGRAFFKVRPSYERDMDQLKLSLGATIAYTGDTLNDARQFNLYPAVRVGYEVLDERLLVYGGVGGDLQRVSLYQLTRENPFLAPNVRVADINNGLDVYGGLQGNAAQFLQFNARVSYKTFRNLFFYNNSRFDTTRFELVYDEDVVSTVNFYGELIYNRSETFRLGLKADYTSYSLENLAQPFHRPALQTSIFGSYNIYDKILINAELYYISSTFGAVYRNPGSEPVFKETDNIVDLNLKGDYRFSNKFSTFVMVNNILGNNYQRFVHYPNKGINVIAGLTYSF